LDLSLYGEDDYNTLRLKLEGGDSDNNFIEVSLKAVPVVKQPQISVESLATSGTISASDS